MDELGCFAVSGVRLNYIFSLSLLRIELIEEATEILISILDSLCVLGFKQ